MLFDVIMWWIKVLKYLQWKKRALFLAPNIFWKAATIPHSHLLLTHQMRILTKTHLQFSLFTCLFTSVVLNKVELKTSEYLMLNSLNYIEVSAMIDICLDIQDKD